VQRGELWLVLGNVPPVQRILDGVVHEPELLQQRTPAVARRTSKAEPRRQQDWILMCLQGGRARPLTAYGVATLCCSPPGALLENKLGFGNGEPHQTRLSANASAIFACTRASLVWCTSAVRSLSALDNEAGAASLACASARRVAARTRPLSATRGVWCGAGGKGNGVATHQRHAARLPLDKATPATTSQLGVCSSGAY
jgi:hypothetical protein